ncbi:glycosyltransferase [Rhizobium sp. C1]|uniref:glycosyltransferase n=1 Tax=Rhizobium sp. C1 TaxID=1349799 RepID=UPI001E583BAF|nr:glycosyltransferase [Rhizobium sp. C1]MCD2178051.1 glycosyltransferase [Rhizobium sp. C1]
MNAIAFIWDNYGPMHDDRIRAVEKIYVGKVRIIGVELFGKSDTYAWDNDHNTEFEKITLFQGYEVRHSPLKVAAAIVRCCLALKAKDIFLCNYNEKYILLAAIVLRLMGKQVYTMADSKYDDYARFLWREVGKSLFCIPYVGGLSNEARSSDYMRFLGVNPRRIAAPYNTLSLERMRSLSGTVPAPDGAAFAERHFTIVARFVPKKNLAMALDAYAIYCRDALQPRRLHLCGSGELEPPLRRKAQELGISDKVVFHGFLQRDGIARTLGTSIALILPSIEEQFGNVVIEAQALGLPVLLSENCGARDRHVRSGVNGFVFEPDNPQGLAFFMGLIDRDETLWHRMCVSALAHAENGDVARFAEAVRTLVPAE